MYDIGVKTMTVRNIPEDVLSKFKSWAAYHGYNLNDAIIAVMREKGDQVKIQGNSNK